MYEPNMQTTLDQVQLFINYKFKNRDLLIASLWELDSNPYSTINRPGPWMPLAPNTPKPESLASIGRLAVNAISWQLFWIRTSLAGKVDRHRFADFIQVHGAWSTDANLNRVANESGLYPYLVTRKGRVGPRLNAIFGAVWLDAERGLEQVKDAMRELKLIEGNECCSNLCFEGEDWLECLRTYPISVEIQNMG